jgi:riboflavin kinase / FMN adenylyltransferase
MRLFSSLKDFSLASLGQDKAIHLAIGMFDGVHLGHQALLKQMPLRSPNSSCGILSFSPHPSRIVRPQEPTLLLMPYAQQERHLSKLGVDFIIRHPFDSSLASTGALDFLNDLKIYLPALKGIYVGENFRFGRKREGDSSLLEEWGVSHSVELKVLSTLANNGSIVSSSNIRRLLAETQFQAASSLLGYPYYAQGKLEGMPHTPCIQWNPELAPSDGVYKAYLPDLNITTHIHYQKGYILLDKSLRGLEDVSRELELQFLGNI